MLSNLVFSTTYYCPISCKYCGAESGPNEKDRLTREEMINLIDEVYSYGKLQLVVFTGGEPIALKDDLLECIKHCTEKKLATRIVSNAYWAKTPKAASELIKKYKDAGLSEINLSCDDYHQEFIPVEFIKNANDACIEHEMSCLIGHKIMKDCSLTLEQLEEELGNKLTLFDEKKKNPDNNVVSTGYTVPIEKDMHLIPDEEILYPPSPTHWQRPCSSILSRIIITPHKELSICCGMIQRDVPEITFGSLDEYKLEELILIAHKDLIVNWLAMEGPYGLMKFIQQKDTTISFRKNYVNICHLCAEILSRDDCRQILAEYGGEKTSEISLEKSLYEFIRSSKNTGELAFEESKESI